MSGERGREPSMVAGGGGGGGGNCVKYIEINFPFYHSLLLSVTKLFDRAPLRV